MWAEAAPNARLKETKDCASNEKPRTKPSTPNDSDADAATEMERTHHQASARSSAELLSREQESHRKTKTALTTREEFLAIVSHDLRNPLNHISMAAQNLFEEPGEPKDVKEIASSIK